MSQFPPNQQGQQWQQPNAYQQPQQPFMPSQFMAPPPEPPKPPKKKRGVKAGILLLALLFICIGIVAFVSRGAGNHSATTTSTVTSATTNTTTIQQTWKTVQTFSGNGSKKTGTFNVPGDWQITWTCNPASFQNLDYNVIITVYNSDGTLSDSGVNATCKKGATSDTTEIHTSGNVFLDIVSEGDWKIEIRELK